LNPDSVDKAIEGSDYVVHTASPVTFKKSEEEEIRTAVEGTLSVLRACTNHGVRRVVVTSSCAAICAMASTDKPDPDTGCYDESCWSNPSRPEGMGAYLKSKTLAEKAAWDFVNEHNAKSGTQRLELVTICPTLVEGPSLIVPDTSSPMMILNFINGVRKEVPKGGQGLVDVRDVSMMHLESIRRPDAAGHRFIAYSERLSFKEYAAILAEAGFTVPTAVQECEGDRDARVNNQKAKDFFKFEFISGKESILTMAESLHKYGLAKKH
jgi:dihydroflavonol-4-reductase